MTDTESARLYLDETLQAAGIKYKDASACVGRNAAYIQQYIKTGKPLWLKEPEREALVAAYSLDPERLKPPPRPLRPSRDRKGRELAGVEPDSLRKQVEEAEKLRLFAIWPRLDPAVQRAMITLALAAASGRPKTG